MKPFNKEKEGDKVVNLYNNARSGDWVNYQTRAQRWEEFALGEQLSEKQKSDLNNAGMPTFVINKITAGLTNLKYYVTANSPSFMATARDGKSTDLADIHQNVLSYNSYISSGKSVNETVVHKTLSRGAACYYVYVDKDSDAGRGDVKYGFLDYADVFVDPASSDKVWDDAAWILVRKFVTRGRLKVMFPNLKSKLDKAKWVDDRRMSYSERDMQASKVMFPEDISSVVDTEGKQETRFPIFELYEKVKIPLCRVTILEQPDKAKMRVIQDQVKQESKAQQADLALKMEDQLISLKEEFDQKRISKERFEYQVKMLQLNIKNQVMNFETQRLTQLVNEKTYSQVRQITKDEYELLSKSKVFKNKIVEKVDFNGIRIKFRQQIGNEIVVRDDILPTDKYPVIPVFFLHTGTPYPISAVSLVEDKQREITKAHQLMLHNVNLASNVRVMAKMGSIDEANIKKLTEPGGVAFWTGMEKPEVVYPQNITNAFTDLILKSEADLEDILGSSQVMRGAYNPEQTTARGIYAADEQGSRGIRAWVTNMYEPALEQLGKVLTDFDQAVYKNHKIFRIMNPDTGDMKTFEVNKPVYDIEGKIVSKYFDYDATQFDVRIISGSTLPVDRFKKLNMAIEMLKLGCATRREVIEQSDFTNKEQMIAELSEIEQLRGQVEQLDKLVKNRDGDIQTFEREISHLRIKEKVNEQEKVLVKHLADFDARYEKELANMKAEMKIVLERTKDQQKKEEPKTNKP